MARQVLNAVTTLNTGTHIDPMTLDLYALRELISTPSYGAFSAYVAANPKVTFVSGGVQTVVAAPGATAAASFITPAATATVYSLLGMAGIWGPGIQARWDGATANRYLAFGRYDNASTWLEFWRLEVEQGNWLSTGNGALGYGAGSGGVVTQATSKSTAVTLNRTAGVITMNAASLGAGARVQFLLNNSQIGQFDGVVLTQNESVSGLPYEIKGAVGTGYCRITVWNSSAGALAEAIVINFQVIKGSNA